MSEHKASLAKVGYLYRLAKKGIIMKKNFDLTFKRIEYFIRIAFYMSAIVYYHGCNPVKPNIIDSHENQSSLVSVEKQSKLQSSLSDKDFQP